MKIETACRACALMLACTVVPLTPAHADTGARVFGRWCAGCHADTPFSPATVYLRATRGDAFAVIEQRTDLTAAFVSHIVRKGRAGMPSFRRVEISDAELQAVADYLAKNKAADE